MTLRQLAGVSLLCVGLQRLMADALLGAVHLAFRVSSDSSFYGIRLFRGFWAVLACIAAGVVLGLLRRDLRRQRVRRADVGLLVFTGLLSVAIATQFGTTTALWQTWTPSRSDSAPFWACLLVDLVLTLCGVWSLRSGASPGTGPERPIVSWCAGLRIR